MAITLGLSLRNARLDAVTAAVGGGGLIRIYSGSRPATVNTAITNQVLLATLTGSTPFAPAASGGVLTVSAISDDAAADADGVSSWFRVFKADGTSPVLDGSIGLSGSGADMILNNTSIVAGGPVKITSFVLTESGASLPGGG